MERPYRVLQAITTNLGGAGQHVLALTKGLLQLGWEVEVAMSPDGPLDEEFAATGALIHKVQMDRRISPFQDLRALYEIRRLLAVRKYDLLATHTSKAGFIGRLGAFGLGTPVVHMVHAYASDDHLPPVKREIFRLVERALNPLTTHYIAGSEAIRQMGLARKIMQPDRISMIHYSLELDRFATVPERTSSRSALGLGENEPVVGWVGRFERQKSPDTFVRMAKEVAKRLPDVHFAMIGDGPLMAQTRRVVDAAGLSERFHFLGWLKEIPTFMAAMDVFVLLSEWEAFGLVFAEAQVCRIPVVGTGVQGIPEVVLDGKTGILVPPFDYHAAAEGVLRLLGNAELRTAMGEAGREWVLKTYDGAKMVSDTAALYQKLIRRKA